MGLGGEVHDHVGARHHVLDGGGVADVALDEPVARAVGDRGEVLLVARVGQLVEHHHLGVGERRVGTPDQLPHVVGADEAGTTCHQNAHLKSFTPV